MRMGTPALLLIGSILLGLGGCRSDDTFYIEMYSSGLLFGPFQNKNFSKVGLVAFNDGASDFSTFDGYVVHPKKWQKEAYRRLHKTTVSIDVKDQSLKQFAETLNEIQRKNGVSESDRVEFSVRIHRSWFGEEMILDDDVTGGFTQRKRILPIITLHAEDATLFDVLLYLSRLLSNQVAFFEFGNEVELYLKPSVEIQ